MIKFNKLFEVKFFHQYYEGYTVKDLIITPTNVTSSLFSSYGIIFRQTADGVVLLYNESKQSLLEKLKEELKFEFAISIRNKHFETFTSLTPSSENHKYLFSNKKSSKGKNEEGEEEIKLHADGFASENELCLCCFNNVVLRELLDSHKVIIQQNGDEIYNGELEEWHTAGKILGNSYGKYSVAPDKKEAIDLLYLPPNFIRAFGMLELAIGGDGGTFEELKGHEYTVEFDSRLVQWNYYFVSENGKLYESANLFSGKEKLPVSNQEHMTLINGQQALKVMSEDKFALKHRYKDKNLYAELTTTLDDGDAEQKKVNLITPDVTRIKGKKENDSENYFSDMYIYL